jgi:hypothetical protein
VSEGGAVGFTSVEERRLFHVLEMLGYSDGFRESFNPDIISASTNAQCVRPVTLQIEDAYYVR